MHKINLSQTVVDEFFTSIKELFPDGKLQKVEDKKVLWTTSWSEIDKLIKKKLQAFDPQISFEKIIKADYAYLQKIAQFINAKQKIKTIFLPSIHGLKSQSISRNLTLKFVLIAIETIFSTLKKEKTSTQRHNLTIFSIKNHTLF